MTMNRTRNERSNIPAGGMTRRTRREHRLGEVDRAPGRTRRARPNPGGSGTTTRPRERTRRPDRRSTTAQRMILTSATGDTDRGPAGAPSPRRRPRRSTASAGRPDRPPSTSCRSSAYARPLEKSISRRCRSRSTPCRFRMTGWPFFKRSPTSCASLKPFGSITCTRVAGIGIGFTADARGAAARLRRSARRARAGCGSR